MQISLVLDIIIAVLLMLTIAYAVRLNQRLSQLRSDKNELQKLARTFADATQRAEAGIQNLKISSEALQTQMKQAEVLKDDLAYLVDRGSRTADEMVETVRSPRGVETRGMETAGAKPAKPMMGRGAKPAPKPTRAMRPAARDDDDEACLIEDAIRAATPEAGGARGADAGLTRRIPGRPLKAAGSGATGSGATGSGASGSGTQAQRERPAGAPPSLASRGLAVPGNDDDFEDTEAARELLKALSSVK